MSYLRPSAKTQYDIGLYISVCTSLSNNAKEFLDNKSPSSSFLYAEGIP